MKFIIFIISFFPLYLLSQKEIIPHNGPAPSEMKRYIIRNATIISSPEEKIQNGDLLIRGDKIEAIGKFLNAPKGTVEIDGKGKVIYPAFIELNSDIGVPPAEYEEKKSRSPQYLSNKKGAFYWNEAIHPEINAKEICTTKKEEMMKFSKMGFGFVLTHQTDGIARGEAALVAINSKNKTIFLPLEKTTSFYSFNKGKTKQAYPSSLMGAIALLRQAIYDAQWYAKNRKSLHLSLEALNQQLKGNLFFVTNDKYDIPRAQTIANEFGLSFTYIGSGNEYGILEKIKSIQRPVVVPLNFPKPYNVKDPYISKQIPLKQLKHWELAPKNPALLVENNINISLTTKGLKNENEFWNHLRKAIRNGLSKEEALRALTINPAKILGIDQSIGSLEKGKIASFIIYDKDPFEEKAKVLETWLLGKQTIHDALPVDELEGDYTLRISDRSFFITIDKKKERFSGKITINNKEQELHADNIQNNVVLFFNINDSIWKGAVTLKGKIHSKFGIIEGEGYLPNGEWVKWTAVKNKRQRIRKKEKKEAENMINDSIPVWNPNTAFGWDSIPEQTPIVIKNATVWTNEADGILKDATVIVNHGKIVFVGNKGHYKTPSNAIIIDAKGKHLTSGIVDEHSHIALTRGVNESGQTVSAEVRLQDVINPEDINIFRQLAGGVTTSQLLHGSANPIGGQSALIKLKWGTSAEEMLIDDAPKFIKFALGENVKQSNWGDGYTIRYPQTRMGVEQVFIDAFNRALEYEKSWNKFKKGEGKEPKKDLELETLLEILKKERFITCHSYVQSEINMLMHVADSFDFNVNTFTHILEGYKLADKMREHGVAGSTFSDWWAYKYEVKDAIPYNAALMYEQGVLVGINSDDAEMGRRLNQEAAKAVKYGGVPEEEAWKMVTLNPAKMLHIDDRVGSIKVGKDADLVLWTDNPLSINAKVEKTIIEGKIYFDRENLPELIRRNEAERMRIISKMLKDPTPDSERKNIQHKKEKHYHCNTIGEYGEEGSNHH